MIRGACVPAAKNSCCFDGKSMKIILFGASGMVGQGVLRECLLDPDVDGVLSILRSKTDQRHVKLREIEHRDFTDFSAIRQDLIGYDACFYCLGVSSAGMSEADYSRVTYDFTLAAAEVLASANPAMTFVFVSGGGTDSTEKGNVMWARVKGKTENALLRLHFKSAIMFRPGFIQPLHGAKSRTTSYRILYTLLAPLVPVLRAAFPKHILTTESVGQAMLNAAKYGAPKSILEAPDIHELGKRRGPPRDGQS